MLIRHGNVTLYSHLWYKCHRIQGIFHFLPDVAKPTKPLMDRVWQHHWWIKSYQVTRSSKAYRLWNHINVTSWTSILIVSPTVQLWQPQYNLLGQLHQTGSAFFFHPASSSSQEWMNSTHQHPGWTLCGGSFYLPKKGFMSGDQSKPCVMWSEFACSQHGAAGWILRC